MGAAFNMEIVEIEPLDLPLERSVRDPRGLRSAVLSILVMAAFFCRRN